MIKVEVMLRPSGQMTMFFKNDDPKLEKAKALLIGACQLRSQEQLRGFGVEVVSGTVHFAPESVIMVSFIDIESQEHISLSVAVNDAHRRGQQETERQVQLLADADKTPMGVTQ